MIKLMIADDQQLFIEGTKFLLECDPEIKVTALASNGREAYEKCCVDLPDVILMDIMMPVCNGVEATGMIKSEFPSVKIIILTTFNDDENIIKALEEGADGYMLKETGQQELIHTVKGINMGMGIIHQNTYQKVVDKAVGSQKKLHLYKKDFDGDLKLPKNELEIIQHVVEGLGNKEIALKMSMAEGTVRNIISRLLSRFQLKDRVQLAVFAIKNGIYDLEK